MNASRIVSDVAILNPREEEIYVAGIRDTLSIAGNRYFWWGFSVGFFVGPAVFLLALVGWVWFRHGF